MDKDKIWKTGTISLLVLFLGSLGVNISDIASDEGYLPYTCGLSKVPDMLCYKLSRVSNIDGVQRYCYFDRDHTKSFKRCDAGWELLDPDEDGINEKTQIIAYTDNGKYFCDGIGKEVNCVKDGTLEMPFD